MRGIRKCSGIRLNPARIEADERPIRECAGDFSGKDFIDVAVPHDARQPGAVLCRNGPFLNGEHFQMLNVRRHE